jgi:hypothetical protein
VVNPYAEQLTFLDDRTRTRRDHAKYLTLIDAIALLHQHRRVLRTARSGDKLIEYIEVTLDDIALANELAHEVLGPSLDELPPQTRRVLGMIESIVEQEARQRSVPRREVRFTRREPRSRCGMSDAAIRVHLECNAQSAYGFSGLTDIHSVYILLPALDDTHFVYIPLDSFLRRSRLDEDLTLLDHVPCKPR